MSEAIDAAFEIEQPVLQSTEAARPPFIGLIDHKFEVLSTSSV